MLVLPVNVDQAGGQFLHKGGRDRFLVDPEGTPPRMIFPGNDDLRRFPVSDPGFPEQVLHGLAVAFKDQLHQRILFSVRHIVLKRRCRERHIHGPDQDRFAGAGFTGQDVQPFCKGNLLPVDQRQIFHVQTCQHVLLPLLLSPESLSADSRPACAPFHPVRAHALHRLFTRLRSCGSFP